VIYCKKGGKSRMEFKMGNFSIVLPQLHFTIITIIIIIFLVRWSKQLETRRFTVFFYFLISTYIIPIYSHGTKEGVFQLWIPMGFIVVFFYLFRNERNHPSKMKASILGLCIALYQLILIYIE
jgi:cell division protein FtsW (lipid II flippase)